MQAASLFALGNTQILIALFYAGLVCYGFISDIRRLQIPNAIPAALLALFFFDYWLLPGKESLVPHLAAFGITFVITFALYAAGAMGAGDVKLISALMLWAGSKDGPFFLISMALIGGVFAALLILLRTGMSVWPPLQRYVPSRRLRAWAARGVFPYGTAICLAGLLVMPSYFAEPLTKGSPLLPLLSSPQAEQDWPGSRGFPDPALVR